LLINEQNHLISLIGGSDKKQQQATQSPERLKAQQIQEICD